MNKKLVVATTITGAGASAAAAGTLSKNLNSDNNFLDETSSNGAEGATITHTTNKITSLSSSSKTSLEQFKEHSKSDNEYKNFYFGNDSAVTNISSFETNNVSSIDTFANTLTGVQTLTPKDLYWGTYYVGNYHNTRSSLRIHVDRTQYKNKKWKGKLTWFWSFSNPWAWKNSNNQDNNQGYKGFMTFNQATTTEDKKLKLTGGFYFLKKTNASAQWVIDYQKEVKDTDNKTLDKSNFNKYFPKPYWYTKHGGFDKFWYNNWEFINGAGDLDNICTNNDSDCTDKTFLSSSSKTFKFEWSGGKWYGDNCDYWPHNYSCDPIYHWSGDDKSVSAMQWYDYMYGKFDKWSIFKHLTNFYLGAWKRTA